MKPTFANCDESFSRSHQAGWSVGEAFASRGHKVTGIDFLEEPIQRAKRRAVERGVQATFLVMDALALNNLPEIFDNVIDCGLFHVFSDEDRKKYVTGIATVLKPGGRLFLLCFSNEEPGTHGPRRITGQEFLAAVVPFLSPVETSATYGSFY
jgi:cyclopropane fatty-acyl-phospholipid synthase-like methyltransferase